MRSEVAIVGVGRTPYSRAKPGEPVRTVDEYIAAQPAERHDTLHQLRRVILNAEPDAVESISYGMPTYRLSNGHPVGQVAIGDQQHMSMLNVFRASDFGIELEDAFHGGTRTITLRVPARDAPGSSPVLQERQLEVNIPKGVRQGQRLPLRRRWAGSRARGIC